MATKIQFPYTMHCPKCKTGLKIKSPKLVGTRISCPKCKARIDVVTPEEDAVVSYGVEPPPEPEKEPEPTEEELLERELERKRKRRMEILRQVVFWGTVVMFLVVIGGLGYVLYAYAIEPFQAGDLGQRPGQIEE